ncbi:MAG TPA: cupin domain-containing protein [Puia sp.]|jgi:(S)-ureidoglycine aminohydrolase
MKKIILLFVLAATAAGSKAAPAVFPQTSPNITDTMVAQVATRLHGSTRDLSRLDATTFTLRPGLSSPSTDLSSDADRLIIIKDGSLSVSSSGTKKTLGPGGVALIAAGDGIRLSNTSTADCHYYALSFKSRTSPDHERAKQAGPPVFLDWTEMQMKSTDKGESRQIFNRPVAWLSKIDMHATTLNEGQISHPPHTHRNEEIILIRSGNVQMYIGGKYYPAKAGDIVFLTSGTPHNLGNKTKGRCEYFALQWKQ